MDEKNTRDDEKRMVDEEHETRNESRMRIDEKQKTTHEGRQTGTCGQLTRNWCQEQNISDEGR